MKLFTKEINQKLFKQYPMGNNLDKQFAVAKIFNPYGDGRWFLLNSDPEDPDYLWVIVQMNGEVEVGSVSRKELETLRVGRWKLPLERDLSFNAVNAAQLIEGLREGKFYKNGGWVEYSHGGVVKWQDAQIGDSARVIAENKTGLIMQAYGRKFHLKFIDGSEKTYDAKELEFIKEEDEYAKGGKIGQSYMMGDEEVYAKESSIGLDGEVCLFYKKDDSILKCISKNQLQSFIDQGKLKPIMANGGKLPDNYDGKSPEEIWNSMSKDQRQHFIYDHATEIEDYRGEEYGELKSSEIIKAYNSDYAGLDKHIKNRFDNHTRQGQYAKGGGVDEFSVGDMVIIKGAGVGEPNYVQKFNGKGKVVVSTPNSYGLLKVKLYKEKGYSDFNDYGYYKPSELKLESNDRKFAKGGEIVGYEVEYEKTVDGERERDIKSFKLEEKEAAEKFAKEHYGYVENVYKGQYDYAKGGIIVTSIKDIPNFKERLEEGKITYRGLGAGKLADDFFKLAGTGGTRIKVDKKEYYITDEEFDSFSRDKDGKLRIRFDAPFRKFQAGGETDSMATVNEIAKQSGLRAVAVAEWGDKNNINLSTVLKDLKAKKIKGLDIMTAVSGKPNNSYAKKLIAKYGKSGSQKLSAKEKLMAKKRK